MLHDGHDGEPPWEMGLGLGGARRGRNFAFALLVFALLIAFLTAVQQKFSGPPPAETPGEKVAEPSTKLFIVFIDSLRPEDVPLLPCLQSIADTGFSAVVEPCADRLTRPCLKEIYSGRSSFGLLGVYENLVSDRASRGSNLFHDLKLHGLSSAVVHHGELDPFAEWFSRGHVGEETEMQVLSGYIRDGYDLVIYNNSEFDDASHKTLVGTPEYLQALAELNAKLAPVIEALPPEYELIVFGDHGHTNNGRHIQGLDVPTVFLSSGKTFGREPMVERLPMTTYRYLIGAKFGILPPDEYNGADLASRIAPDSTLGRAARARKYDARPRNTPLPGWAWLPPFALLALLIVAGSLRWGQVPTALALAAAAAGSGAAYLWVVRSIHFNINLPIKTQAMAPLYIMALISVAALALRAPRRRAVYVGCALAFVTLPGTLYPYGLFRNLVIMLSAMWLVRVGPTLLAGKGPRAETRQRFLMIGVIVVCVIFIAHVHITNFELKHFRYLRDAPPAACWLAWGFAAGALQQGGRNRWIAGLIAFVGATGWVPMGTYGSLVGTLACVVLLFRNTAWLPCALAWLVPVWYGPANGLGILCCIAFAIATIRACPVELPGRQLLGAITATIMAMYTMAFTAKLRMNGVDFGFAAQWFPGDWYERLWWVLALAVTVEITLPAVLVFRYVERFAPIAGIRSVTMLVCAARICAGMLFLWALLLQEQEIAKFRLLDVIEDNVAWLVVLMLSPFMPSPSQETDVARDAPPAPIATEGAGPQPAAGV